jgi:predicted CDP-diglyceride synthetase/phosphatidate cytidylyltransferase
MSRGLVTLACVLLVGAVILGPFRRRIGGDEGGSEKASVGAWWVIAGVVVAVLVIYR